MMKLSRLLFVLLGILSFSAAAAAQGNRSIPFRFATRAEAQMLVTELDDYTRNWNRFDIDSRLKTIDGRKSQLLSLAMKSMQNWNDAEKERISRVMKSLDARVKKLNLKLPYPKEVILVKSSMDEEGGAGGYTRENWIALGSKMMSLPDEQLTALLAHELFHILTRADLDFKKRTYATIGFTVLDREIIFPSDVIEKRISNPDVSRYDSYAPFTIQGEKKNCTMMFYARKPYDGTGSFMDYSEIGLIPLNENFVPVQENGETVIYPLSAAEDFHALVGENTLYIINPEEILAEHFAILLTGKTDVKSPGMIDGLKKAVSAGK